jgi:hypothetical protein
MKKFTFSTIGHLAAIGKRTGVANILGVNFSGFVAWWLWRTIYLSKLPGLEKKVRVALDWTLDLLFSKDLVQFLMVRAPSVSRAEEGDVIRVALRTSLDSKPVVRSQSVVLLHVGKFTRHIAT